MNCHAALACAQVGLREAVKLPISLAEPHLTVTKYVEQRMLNLPKDMSLLCKPNRRGAI